MSIYFNNDNLNKFIDSEFNTNKSINLSEIYKYLNDNIEANNSIDTSGKKRILFDEIYEILRYVKNQFYKTDRIEIVYDNDFEFQFFNSELLKNYLEFFNFNGNFTINGFSSKSLRLYKIKINGYLNIINHSIESLSIINSEISQGININDVNIKIQLENIKSKKLTINCQKLKYLTITNEENYIGGIDNILIQNAFELDTFFIYYKNNFLINEIELGQLSFNNTNHKNEYYLNNLTTNTLKLSNIFNISDNLSINNVSVKNDFIIHYSNFGKAIFNGVEIGKLEIENATLNDCIFNGVDFKTYELGNNNGKINTKALKDNYRQLKHVMDKNANYTEANNFYALEMEYYLKQLNNDDKLNYKNCFNLLFDNNTNITGKYGEKITLIFSYIINKFGTDVIFNLFIIIYYLLFVYSLSFLANYIYYQNPIISHLLGVLAIIIIYLGFIIYDNKYYHKKSFDNKNEKTNINIGYVIIIMTIGIVTGLSILHFITYDDIKYKLFHFEGIKTFIYLLNPFSGLTPNSMSHLYWTEQIGLIIHKIIYGILIYQLIIALKRTTRR